MKNVLVLSLCSLIILGLGTAVVAGTTVNRLSLNNLPKTLPPLKNDPQTSSSPAQDTQPFIAAPTDTPETTRPSDKSLQLATYFFAEINDDQRTDFINKFSNGKNDLARAINSFALLLDNEPETLAVVEEVYTADLAQEVTDGTEGSSNAISNDFEYSDPVPSSETNTYGNTDPYPYSNTRPLTGNQAPSYKSNNTYQIYTPPSPTPTPVINVYGSAGSYTRYGNTMFGSDGSTYTQYGNTVFGNDGSTHTRYGNTIYGNDGSTSTKYGNTTFNSDGTSYTQYGNTTFGSDGSMYTQYGNTTYSQPGY
jgi:hypothetical protein